jgi:CheY-like chemotaxis protein
MQSVRPLSLPTFEKIEILGVTPTTPSVDRHLHARAGQSRPDGSTDDHRLAGALIGITNPARRSDLAAHLSAAGFNVWKADSGRECLSTFLDHTGDIDVLVLDAGFSDLPGPVFLTRLRVNFPGILCVFLADSALAAALGAQGVWTVPQTSGPATVLAVVRDAIAAADAVSSY